MNREILFNSNILELDISVTLDHQINISMVLRVESVSLGDTYLDEHEQVWMAVTDHSLTNIESYVDSFKIPTKLTYLASPIKPIERMPEYGC